MMVMSDWQWMGTVVAEREGGVCCVERLFSSSLVAIVDASFPCKLRICHFKKGTEICSYNYSSRILALRLNRLVCSVLLLCRTISYDVAISRASSSIADSTRLMLCQSLFFLAHDISKTAEPIFSKSSWNGWLAVSRRPSVLWHCLSGRLTCKAVPEVPCNAWSGTFKRYYIIPYIGTPPTLVE